MMLINRYIVFVFFLLCSNNSFSSEKIVFIDINYIFANSIAGKDLNNEIKSKNEKLNYEIDEIKKKIESQKKKLLSQKNVISVEEYNNKILIIEANIKEMNIAVNKNKNELDKFKLEVEKIFSQKLNSLIETYSVDNSIDIILRKSNLLMAKKNLDITNDILNLFSGLNIDISVSQYESIDENVAPYFNACDKSYFYGNIKHINIMSQR